MTIRELIEVLEKYPLDTEILIANHAGDGWVSDIKIDEDDLPNIFFFILRPTTF